MPNTIDDPKQLGQLASYNFAGFSPAVYRNKPWTNDPPGTHHGYCVRILMKSTWSSSGGNQTKYGYFELDKEGVITSCPRSMTKTWKGTKLADIDKWVEHYKDLPVHHNGRPD